MVNRPVSIAVTMLVTAVLAGPADGARPLDQTDFQACNDRAMQTAGVSPSTVAPRGADEKQTQPGPKNTTVQQGPAPESGFPAASPKAEKVVPRTSGSQSSAVPEAELSRVVQAYQDCLKQRLGVGDRGRHEQEGQTGKGQRGAGQSGSESGTQTPGGKK